MAPGAAHGRRCWPGSGWDHRSDPGRSCFGASRLLGPWRKAVFAAASPASIPANASIRLMLAAATGAADPLRQQGSRHTFGPVSGSPDGLEPPERTRSVVRPGTRTRTAPEPGRLPRTEASQAGSAPPIGGRTRRLLAGSGPGSLQPPPGAAPDPDPDPDPARPFLPVPMTCAQSRPPLQLVPLRAPKWRQYVSRARGSEPCTCLERHLGAAAASDLPRVTRFGLMLFYHIYHTDGTSGIKAEEVDR